MYRGDDEDYVGSIESLTGAHAASITQHASVETDSMHSGCPGKLTEALSSAVGGFVASPAVQQHNSRLVWVSRPTHVVSLTDECLGGGVPS